MSLTRIVDPEHGPCPRPALPAQVSDLGIVAVDDERRIGRQLLHSRPPAAGHELELAVAIELVAEQVAEADRPRPEPPSHLGQRRLVDLEEAELRVSGGEEGRRNPGDEVRTGAVVCEPQLPSQNSRGHRRCRRLAVRRRDERGAERKPAGELIDRRRIELPEQLPGHGRAATGAGKPREASCGAGQEDLQPQRKAGSQGPETLSERGAR